LEPGLKYLIRSSKHRGSYFFYGNYYAVQAMYQAGGKYWEGYFKNIKSELLKTQNRASGRWAGGRGGPAYCTAMAVIILQMPYRFIPIFQR